MKHRKQTTAFYLLSQKTSVLIEEIVVRFVSDLLEGRERIPDGVVLRGSENGLLVLRPGHEHARGPVRHLEADNRAVLVYHLEENLVELILVEL